MPYERQRKTVSSSPGGQRPRQHPAGAARAAEHRHIVDMIQDGTNVVVSHGNGPQVGMINNAFAYAAANDDNSTCPSPRPAPCPRATSAAQLSAAILELTRSPAR